MKFDFDTYIVLDVPNPQAEQVMAIRKHHRDIFRASLPVEITLTGSSGVGVFEIAQDPQAAFDRLNAIAANTAPIKATFGKVYRFPNSDIFVLTLDDERPFQALHDEIANSGLSFKPSPFPYKPHCTLRSRSPVSDSEAAELFAVTISGSFILDTLSVYQMRLLPLTLLHRVMLTGG
jgi:2'-5' RNA ligase